MKKLCMALLSGVFLFFSHVGFASWKKRPVNNYFGSYQLEIENITVKLIYPQIEKQYAKEIKVSSEVKKRLAGGQFFYYYLLPEIQRSITELLPSIPEHYASFHFKVFVSGKTLGQKRLLYDTENVDESEIITFNFLQSNLVFYIEFYPSLSRYYEQ